VQHQPLDGFWIGVMIDTQRRVGIGNTPDAPIGHDRGAVCRQRPLPRRLDVKDPTACRPGEDRTCREPVRIAMRDNDGALPSL
jgi:hypothetical protein